MTTKQRIHLSRFLFFLVCSLSPVMAQALSFMESFHIPAWSSDRWITGSPGYFAMEGDACLFDSGRGNSANYRYTSLAPVDAMGGDFEIEFAFAIRQLDHWNGFSLRVGALDGSWSAELSRQQRQPGQHFIYASITQNGKKDDQAVSESAEQGSFRFVRKGTILTFAFKPEKGEWKVLREVKDISSAPVRGELYFWSPAGTRNIVQLRSFHQTWQHDVPNHLYPLYGTPKTLADQGKIGGIHLMHVEKGKARAGQVAIEPGGRAVFAVQAPLNARSLNLNFESKGAIKVSMTQIGSAESIQLGLAVLWDEQPDKNDQLTSRAVSLEPFLSRFPEPKRVTFTHLTSNNMLFFTFRPSAGQPVLLRSLSLSGCDLVPVKPFSAEKKAASKMIDKGDFRLVEWTGTTGAGKWWGERAFPAGKMLDMAGVPFKVSPTVLDRDGASVEIPINQSAGLIHIAHCAGHVEKDRDWVGAYLLVYEDGDTETIFCNLGWNCGSYFGDNWTMCDAMNTWWGPAQFTFAKLHYLPRPGLSRGVFWNGIYVATYANPHPEKRIEKILAYVPPKSVPFALVGITLTPPEKSRLGLVEPSEAAFAPGKDLQADVMLWSATTQKYGEAGALHLAKPTKTAVLARGALQSEGPFAFAGFSLRPTSDLMEPGPVTLQYRAAQDILAVSSSLGWMPAPNRDDKPCYLSMIAGGFESRWELERLRRLGYDSIKAHMGWEQVEPQPGKFDFSRWQQVIPYIHQEGLDVSIRNQVDVPSWLTDKVSWRVNSKTGQPDKGYAGYVDMADPAYGDAVVRYYIAVAQFLKSFPYVISINANYGTRGTCGSDGVLRYGPKFHMAGFRKLLAEKFSLTEVNSKTGMHLAKWEDIGPQEILADKSSFLLEYYVRAHNLAQADLIRRIVQGIRGTGNTSHLVFNTSMHNQWHTLQGHPLDHYLQIGLDFPPASPFHESCDRYGLSFYKWLAAKRTFGLPYGDEGNRNPPPYEQNIRSYEWMMMFQCWDALYCMWWNGKPGSQNIAWLKPYYRMIYNAEYVPDPIALAFSYESGFAEAPAEWKESDTQKPVMCHYGLVNTLRALNMNADRYVMDHFPQTDARAGKFILDDISRLIDDKFADRLEKLIRNGATFVASPDTDLLRGHQFLKRFGIDLSPLPYSTQLVLNGVSTSLPGTKWKIDGKNLEVLASWKSGGPAVVVKTVGKGRIIVFGKTWDQGDYDINVPDNFLHFCRTVFCRFGQFTPVVQSSETNVDVTLYKTRDGRLLMNAFNNTVLPKNVDLRVLHDVAADATRALDLGRGEALQINEAGQYRRVKTTIAPLQNTVIEWSRPRK